MKSLAKYVGVFCVAGLAIFALASQAAQQLLIDGKVVSNNLTQANGRYEVPVDDVAAYFGYTVNIAGGQATLTKIAPAPAPPGTGDVLASRLTAGTTDPTVTTTTIVPPMNISVALGATASVNGFDYAVTSINDVGAKYKDVYDQRGATMHPRWKTDTLVIVNLTVTNSGTTPVPAQVPSASDITVFDTNKIGYQATGIDQRQSSDAVTAGYDDIGGIMTAGSSTLVLAPGGTLHFAAIASVPKGDSVTSVTLRLAGSSAAGGSYSPGATVMVSR